MDHKVNKILTDTETLLDQYRKKISDIGKNLETTKRYREEINLRVGGFERQLNSIADNCDNNHSKFSQHVDHISLKFAETTVDLNSANEGFQREIERANLLFKELQKAFVTELEEKRQHNEALLRGAGIEEKELRKVNRMAETAS